MQRHVPLVRGRPARILASLASAGFIALGLAACGSSTPSSSASTVSAKHQGCIAVSDVLADGPTTDADPVGYAQAQVLPLRQLKISYPALAKSVTQLATAYDAYSTSNGASSTAVNVTTAEARVNAICPHAAP